MSKPKKTSSPRGRKNRQNCGVPMLRKLHAQMTPEQRDELEKELVACNNHL